MWRDVPRPRIDRDPPVVEPKIRQEVPQLKLLHEPPELENRNNPVSHHCEPQTWKEPEFEAHYVLDGWSNKVKIGVIGIILAVYHGARGMLITHRNRIWWLTTIYYAWTILCGAQYLLIEAVQPAFLCKPPISMVTQIAYCPKPDTFSPDFRQLVTLQYQLQDAMEKSSGALIIAVGVKRSELAVRDLAILVEDSSLVARDSLTKNLVQFANDAKTAGRSLQRFGGRVGSAVDQVVAMNEYAVELLGRVAGGQERSLISSLTPQDPVARSRVTKEVWFEATSLLKSEVGKLIEEASTNMRALDRLENELSVIHTMAVRENKAVTKNKTDALSGLWTELFGPNQTQVAQFDEHAQLLKDIIKYREDAVYHVTGTLMQLQQLEIGLENLNQQATRALFRQKVVEIPLEVHIRALQKGTERLIEGQRRAREREDDFMREMLNNRRRQ